MQAVIDGAAVGLVEPGLVERDLAAGRIVRLFDVSIRVAPGMAFYVVYPERSRDDPRVVAFQWLAAQSASTAR